MTSPSVSRTAIDGLLVVSLERFEDPRGWFEEAWQQRKFSTIGLSNFVPVQQNVSFNEDLGVTRGLHAEPWNKLVTVLSGSAHGAWVDLREGEGFGKTFEVKLTPGLAVLVPKGVANGYQVLQPNTVYSYLVDDHWSANANYLMVDALDPDLKIRWPLSEGLIRSDKDLSHPRLRDLPARFVKKAGVIGRSGQVAKELAQVLPGAANLPGKALTDNFALATQLQGCDWIVNAAAFTQVDNAELPEFSSEVMEGNYLLVSRLASLSRESRSTLVHFSSDYVFDGSSGQPYSEQSEPNPVSRYGMSKLMGDLAAMQNPRHYILRTSWVFGDGKNFIDSMRTLAEKSQGASVVADQFGRPTSARDLALAAAHLLANDSTFGIYNLSGEGPIVSWAELAKFVYSQVGADPNLVTEVSTEEYFAGRSHAPRPKNSALALGKIKESGFTPRDWRDSVAEHLGRSR